MQTKKHSPYDTIRVETHHDLRKNIRAISTRFNEAPELARLLLVNPILAFKDAGVDMTREIEDHIMNSLRFPKRLVEKKERLEAELREELKELGLPAELPLSAETRAHLLFRVLKLQPLPEDACSLECIESRRARYYSRRHPIVAKLADYERARQGGVVFRTKEQYEAYKTGQKRHNWVKSVRFKI